MIRVALTGGAGSGKSTAAAEFSRLGVPTLDTDEVSRTLLLEPPIRAAIAARFPEYITPSGTIQRRQLRDRIAQDPDAKRWLEDLLHPKIWQYVEGWLTQQQHDYAVVSVPLLVEAGWVRYFPFIVLIEATPEIRLQRLCQRDGISPEEALRLIAVQTSHAELRRIANAVLDNSRHGTDTLLRGVQALDAQLRASCRLNHPPSLSQHERA